MANSVIPSVGRNAFQSITNKLFAVIQYNLALLHPWIADSSDTGDCCCCCYCRSLNFVLILIAVPWSSNSDWWSAELLLLFCRLRPLTVDGTSWCRQLLLWHYGKRQPGNGQAPENRSSWLALEKINKIQYNKKQVHNLSFDGFHLSMKFERNVYYVQKVYLKFTPLPAN